MSDKELRPDIVQRRDDYLSKRRSSHASVVRLPHHRENALERTASISTVFHAAHANRTRDENAGLGSDMVRREKPHPAPRPSPDIAAPVDAASHKAALDRERRRAEYMQQRIIETNLNPERRNR